MYGPAAFAASRAFKNNWIPHRSDYNRWTQEEIQLDRRPPGNRFRHLLTIAQVRAFLPLLPEWEPLTYGLDAIVLAEGDATYAEWYERKVFKEVLPLYQRHFGL